MYCRVNDYRTYTWTVLLHLHLQNKCWAVQLNVTGTLTLPYKVLYCIVTLAFTSHFLVLYNQTSIQYKSLYCPVIHLYCKVTFAFTYKFFYCTVSLALKYKVLYCTVTWSFTVHILVLYNLTSIQSKILVLHNYTKIYIASHRVISYHSKCISYYCVRLAFTVQNVVYFSTVNSVLDSYHFHYNLVMFNYNYQEKS